MTTWPCASTRLIFDSAAGSRPVADHGLCVALHHDVALGLDPIDFGIAAAAAAFGVPVVGDQRIGMDFALTTSRDGIAARDVEMRVLLPFDARIGLDLD